MLSLRRISLRLILLLALLLGAGCGGQQRQVEQGLAALRAGDAVGAVGHFTHAIELEPQNATAYCNLGAAYWTLGSTENAIHALTMASDLESNDPRPQLLLAEVLQDARRWDEAREVLTKVNNGLPDRPDVLTRLAQLEYRAGNVDQAVAHLEAALRLDGQYAPALYDMAVVARDQRHDTLSAMRFFSRYLSVATNQGRIDKVHEELARLRMPFRPAAVPPHSEGSVAAEAAAVPVARTPAVATPAAPATPVTPLPPLTTRQPAVESGASMAVGLLAQARKAIEAKSYDEALVLFSQARAKDPHNADIVWATAMLYDQQLGQPKKAEGFLRDFVMLFPGDYRVTAAQRRLGNVASGRPSVPAVTTTVAPPPPPTTTVRVATAQKLTLAEVWQKGLDAHAAGKWDEAIRYYETTLTLDPTFASAAFNMGAAYKAKGALQEARQSFRKAAALDPAMEKAQYMLAVVNRELGDRSRAIESGKRALAIAPRDGKTHYLLGLLYRESLRYDLARYHFKRASELAADRGSADKARAALESVPTPGAKR